MIADRTSTSAELKGPAEQWQAKASLPVAMDKAHGAKLDKLRGLNGAEFTKPEVMRVSAHKGAVSLFERYAKSGDDADVNAFAA